MAKTQNTQSKKGKSPKTNRASLNSNGKEIARQVRKHKRVIKTLARLQALAKTTEAIIRFDSLITSENIYIKGIPARYSA